MHYVRVRNAHSKIFYEPLIHSIKQPHNAPKQSQSNSFHKKRDYLVIVTTAVIKDK